MIDSSFAVPSRDVHKANHPESPVNNLPSYPAPQSSLCIDQLCYPGSLLCIVVKKLIQFSPSLGMKYPERAVRLSNTVAMWKNWREMCHHLQQSCVWTAAMQTGEPQLCQGPGGTSFGELVRQFYDHGEKKKKKAPYIYDYKDTSRRLPRPQPECDESSGILTAL